MTRDIQSSYAVMQYLGSDPAQIGKTQTKHREYVNLRFAGVKSAEHDGTRRAQSRA